MTAASLSRAAGPQSKAYNYVSMSTEHRLAAERRVNDLIAAVRALPPHEHLIQLIEEAESLARAIAAFHLEGIRFRMFNVDRMATKSPVALPVEVTTAVADIHRHLEAAGFHTRSHQAPGSP
jgi:hypothetical protein